MKIAILGPCYPLRGGISQHTGLLFSHLLSRGCEVKLFSFKKQFPKFLFPGKTQLDQSASPFAPSSEPVFIPYNPFSWFRAWRQIIAGRFDVLICVHWMPFTAAGYAAVCRMVKKKTPTPILYLLHNVIPHERMPGMRLLTRFAFRFADGFIVQSRKVESELIDFFPPGKGKWRRIVPHPVYNFQDFSSPTRNEARKLLGITEAKTLLYFGLIRQYKGLKTLLEAFPTILDHFDRDIRLMIAGEFYDPPEPYMELMSKLGISDYVTVHNRFIPNEEVGGYFAAADVVVLPYVSASQSGVVQAAFGFGKPVISTEVGGLPEAVSHGLTGLLCPPEDPEALSQAVIEFYRLSDTVDWRGNIEREREKFSWNNFSSAIEDFWEYIRKD